MTRDVRQAIRSLLRARSYAVAVIGVIALTLGLVLATFAVVDGPLFRPLPFQDAERLFVVNGWWSRLAVSKPEQPTLAPIAVFTAWRAALPEAAFTAIIPGSVVSIGPQQAVRATRVDPSFFRVLGGAPASGGFDPADFALGATVTPALISHRLWVSRFGADPSVVGRTYVDDDGRGIRVVGVLKPDFIIPDPRFVGDDGSEVITPMPAPEDIPEAIKRSMAQSRFLAVMVRLPPSIGSGEAASRLRAALDGLADTWPAASIPADASDEIRQQVQIAGRPFDTVALQTLRETLTADVRRISWAGVGAALVPALLACVNVIALSIARVRDRSKDFAIRLALGAGASSLARLMAVEIGILVTTGTIVGLVLARPAIGAIGVLVPASLSYLKVPVVDIRVVAVAAGAVIIYTCAITIGVVRTVLRSEARSIRSLERASRSGAPLTAAQVTLGLVLTLAGALVGSSLLRAWNRDVGLSTDRAAIVRVAMPATSSAEIEQLLGDLRRRPSIRQAGGLDQPILIREGVAGVFRDPSGHSDPRALSAAVTSGFFDAAGLRPSRGRLPSDAEIVTGAPLIVVSESLARRYWPDTGGVGESLTTDDRAFTVVGVVQDVRYRALDEEARGAIYWPIAAQRPSPIVTTMLIRFRHDDPAALADVVAWLRSHCAKCLVRDAMPLTDAMAWSIRARRLNAWLFSSFSVVALVIVGTGILGVVGMAVAARTKEIGLRIALGATRTRIVRHILTEQMTAVVSGLVIGAGLSIAGVRFLRAYLFETTAFDVWSWAIATCAIAGVAFISAFLPSLRASRTDPLVTLRGE